MATVTLTASGREELLALPVVIRNRVLTVLARLENWPTVSGAKSLRGDLKGNWRIRTGDYRVIFIYDTSVDEVIVWKIGYRGGVYDI